jgi:predicted protein tyrosine phosphatase
MAIERLSVLDLESAARLPGDPDTAVVSVTDPAMEAPLASGFGGILRLAFHDVDDRSLALLEREPRLLGEAVTPFSPDQARELVTWTDALAAPGAPGHVVVHCMAGISRSSAIAWFLAHRHGADLHWQAHFMPNRRVLRLLVEVSGLAVPEPRP